MKKYPSDRFIAAPPADSYTVSPTGMLKHNGGKLHMECLPPLWKELLARHMEYGAFYKKPAPYGLGNWEKGGKVSLLLAALERHVLAFQQGETVDAESGSHHLVAAATNALMVVSLMASGKAEDDRPATREAARDVAGCEEPTEEQHMLDRLLLLGLGEKL